MDIDYLDNDNSDCDEDLPPPSKCVSHSCSYYDRLETSVCPTDPIYPRPEQKIIDVGVSGGTTSNSLGITSAGAVVALNDDIIAGSNVRQMIGNQVTIRSLSYRFLPPSPAPCRITFIWDRQPNGVVPAYSDIFSVFGASTISVYNHQNPNNRQRFIILRDFTYPNPLNGTVNFECGKIPIDMVSTYTNPQSSALIPQTGALLLSAIISSSSIQSVLGILRIRYYDN